MPFIPHTEADISAMLDAIGVNAIDDLFDEIPEALRSAGLTQVPEGLSEMEVARLMQERAEQAEHLFHGRRVRVRFGLCGDRRGEMHGEARQRRQAAQDAGEVARRPRVIDHAALDRRQRHAVEARAARALAPRAALRGAGGDAPRPHLAATAQYGRVSSARG